MDIEQRRAEDKRQQNLREKLQTRWERDGSAAFPCEGGPDSGLFPDPGMSTRMYIATQAMKGLLAGQFTDSADDTLWVASHAVAHADALIAQLNKD